MSGSGAKAAAYSTPPASLARSRFVNKAPALTRPPRLRPATWLLVAGCAGVAVLGLAAVWMAVAAHFRSPSVWMLLVVTLDAALLLRLAGLPAGRLRCALVAAISALTVLAAVLLVSASQIGLGMGMAVQHALPALSPGLVALYLQSQLQWSDALWLLPSAWLAWRFGRR